MENKKMVLAMLQATLGETNTHEGIRLDLDDMQETVTVTYRGGSKQYICVACDSASAMIRDVMRQLKY